MSSSLCIPRGISLLAIAFISLRSLVLAASSPSFSSRGRVLAFSSTPGGGGGGGGGGAAAQFDRFRAECPAPPAAVALFDPTLTKDAQDDDQWVAVYRSSNNLPSVIMRDDLFNSMRIATTIDPEGIETGAPAKKEDGSDDDSDDISKRSSGAGKGVEAQTPVAVARLRPSPQFAGSYLIDDMRCSLKKEDTNDECDGGSEHTEALGVCIDELIMQRLRTGSGAGTFDGTIRAKATLVSAPLLSERGFEEVDGFPLPPDMCTHVSNLDASMERYADRVVGTGAKNVGARDRALKVLSLLGRLNREEERKATKEREGDSKKGEDGEDDYDPWANVKLPGQWK